MSEKIDSSGIKIQVRAGGQYLFDETGAPIAASTAPEDPSPPEPEHEEEA